MQRINIPEKYSFLTIFIQVGFFVFLLSTMLFNRSFVGLYIFGYRFGELLILIAFLISIIFLFTPKRYLEEFYFNDI